MIFTGDSVLEDGIHTVTSGSAGADLGDSSARRTARPTASSETSGSAEGPEQAPSRPYLLSANRVLADDDAIKETDQSWDDIVQEANRPDGLIKVYPLSQRGIEIQNETRLATEHVALMTQGREIHPERVRGDG